MERQMDTFFYIYQTQFLLYTPHLMLYILSRKSSDNETFYIYSTANDIYQQHFKRQLGEELIFFHPL